MSALLVDSGNSSIKWAILREGRLADHARVARDGLQSLRENWWSMDKPGRIMVANVAGLEREREIRDIARKLWGLEAGFVRSVRTCCGLTNGYDDPASLGVDRWLAMIAAFHLANGPLIVIDCGTAVTIDLVDGTGVHRGGVIMAGLGLSRRALSEGTDALAVHDSAVVCAASTGTRAGIVSGTLMGLAGAIERIVREQEALLDANPAVYMCGGDARRLLPFINCRVEVIPDLVLIGLQTCLQATKGIQSYGKEK